MPQWLRAFHDEATSWCEGRYWNVRAPLLVYLAYAGVSHLRSAEYLSWFGGINLGIHELGHIVLSPFGEFLGFAGGTLLQLAAPATSAALFYRQCDYFAIPVATAWLSFSMFETATYMADARARIRPLLAFSENAEHDWTYLFSALGLLSHDTTVAAMTRLAAALLWAASILLGTYLCAQMYRRPRPPDAPPRW